MFKHILLPTDGSTLSLRAAKNAVHCGKMVPGKGFEPSTVALQMRCSTN